MEGELADQLGLNVLQSAGTIPPAFVVSAPALYLQQRRLKQSRLNYQCRNFVLSSVDDPVRVYQDLLTLIFF